MYVLEDGNVKAECVVTDEDNGILEIKNIAVDPQNQGQGYGKALIDFLVSKYADEYSILQVGTGDSPLTVPFYENADLSDLTIFRISLRTIMTTQFMSVVYS